MQIRDETRPAVQAAQLDAASSSNNASAQPDADILRLRQKYRRQRFERNKRRHQRKQAAALCGLLLLLFALAVGIKACVSHFFRGDNGTASSEPSQSATLTLPSFSPSASPSPTPASPEPPQPEVPVSTVTLMAVGDNLMHNTVMEYGHLSDGTYDFLPLYEAMAEDIQAADIACINQETIYIDDPSEYTNYPAFGGPTAIGEALAELGFDVVTHAPTTPMTNWKPVFWTPSPSGAHTLK